MTPLRVLDRPLPVMPPAPLPVAASPSDYLSADDMAAIMGVSVPTMRQYLRARGTLGLPACLTARRWRTTRTQFMAWYAMTIREGWHIRGGDGGVRVMRADGTQVAP